MAGLSDIVATVTVSKSEYEELVRCRAQLECIKNYIDYKEFASVETIKVLLGMGEE